MRKSIFTARQEWTPAYARVTKARGGVNKLRSEAFAMDEHGITRKREANKPKEIHLPRMSGAKNPFRHFRECGNPYLQQGKNGPPHTRG